MSYSTKLHLLPISVIALTMIIGTWVITSGTGDIFGYFLEREQSLADRTHSKLHGSGVGRGFPRFFDAQGDAILNGHLDISCSFIGHEAYIVDGRCYGYFGITPAILRILLNSVYPRAWGHWTIISMEAASFVFLISAYGLALKLHLYLFNSEPFNLRFVFLVSMFLLALGLGSTNIFLLSRPAVYHEAIIWSCALAVSALYFAMCYMVAGRLSSIILMGIAALFAFHTRPIAGVIGVLLCLVVPALRTTLAKITNLKKSAEEVWMQYLNASTMTGFVAAVLTVVLYGAVNFGKFGLLEGMPIRFNYSPERVAAVDGSMFHLSNLRWNAEWYFGFDGVTFSRAFPFVVPSFQTPTKEEIALRYPESRVDAIEPPHMGIPSAMSALLVMASRFKRLYAIWDTWTGLDVSLSMFGIRGEHHVTVRIPGIPISS